MKDHYLKFESRQHAEDVLIAAGLGKQKISRETGDVVLMTVNGQAVPAMEINMQSMEFSIHVVGEIVRGGELNLETMEPISPIEKLTGFHVNVRMIAGKLPEALKPFEIFPKTPDCVFA